MSKNIDAVTDDLNDHILGNVWYALVVLQAYIDKDYSNPDTLEYIEDYESVEGLAGMFFDYLKKEVEEEIEFLVGDESGWTQADRDALSKELRLTVGLPPTEKEGQDTAEEILREAACVLFPYKNFHDWLSYVERELDWSESRETHTHFRSLIAALEEGSIRWTGSITPKPGFYQNLRFIPESSGLREVLNNLAEQVKEGIPKTLDEVYQDGDEKIVVHCVALKALEKTIEMFHEDMDGLEEVCAEIARLEAKKGTSLDDTTQIVYKTLRQSFMRMYREYFMSGMPDSVFIVPNGVTTH